MTLNTVIGFLAQAAQVDLSGPVGNAISQLKWSWFWQETKPRKIQDFQLYNGASRGPLGALTVIFRARAWQVSCRYHRAAVR